jgi:hypothetical protein
MRRVERISERMFGIENSTVDPNKFYSILLDARAASVSENMCDIAEKLLSGEKDNAKGALEHLWKLKKNLFSGKNATIDMLISYYQDKMDILRGKEEHLRKVSLDSRNLLEEKRKKDEEVASVKQQVTDCTRELNELTRKLDKLKIKEQELELIEHQLAEELHRNENEIVNGLYEIILAQQDAIDESESQQQLTVQGETGPVEEAPAAAPVELPPPATPLDDLLPAPTEQKASPSVFQPPAIASISPEELLSDTRSEEGDTVGSSAEAIEPRPADEPPPFPKTVVKMGGRVIGEYYYDSTVYKNERHYICNSAFFAEHLLGYIRQLKRNFDQSVNNEMCRMIQDAQKRVTEDKEKRLHFEVATNEILNEKSLQRLLQDAKLRSFDEVERFGVRLQAKIDAMGINYNSILKEQMQRCSEKS